MLRRFRFVSFLYRFVRNSSNLVNPRIISRSIGQHFFAKKKNKKNNKAKSPRLTSRRFPRNFPSLRPLLSSAVSSNFQENDTPFQRPHDSPPPFCHAANVIQLFMVTSSVRPYQQVTPVYNSDETKRIVP